MKLKNLGLITEAITFESGGKEQDTNQDNLIINLYCKKFLNFIVQN